jgi:linoleoyl-CoA desaturase
MARLTFNNRNTAFYTTLKSSVDQYFTTSSLRKTGNWRLYAKTVILIPGALLVYSALLFGFRKAAGPFSPAMILAGLSGCILLGLILASIGFNVMHDACHGSYSRKKWVNDLMGLSLNACGGNAFIWKFKHNIIHHTYTNVDGLDDDIAKSPFMRSCKTQKWMPAHRYQHLYVIVIYALSSFLWVTVLDYVKYFSRKVVSTPLQKMDFKEHFVFWLSKALYIVFYVAIPVYFVGWSVWLAGFACMHIALGIVLAIVFQLAHVVEEMEFEYIEEGDVKKLEQEWAIHQLRTTANFARRNKIVSWYVGGLNYQVEHHLFPRISHIHYPAISNIVKKTCEEYGVAYHEFPTMVSAIGSHFRIMRELGKKPASAL